MLGWAEDQFAVLGRAKVNLAPLRFGAGVKGKITDGWHVGTPAVSTPIGFEGMGEREDDWGGIIGRGAEALAHAAVGLHEDERHWLSCQAAGTRLMRRSFDYQTQATRLQQTLDHLRSHRERARESNVVGAMLWHHAHQSSVYFSKWIELKNRPAST